MAFTTPRTWANGELVNDTIMNAHVRDNLRYLKGLDGPLALSDALTVLGLTVNGDMAVTGNATVAGAFTAANTNTTGTATAVNTNTTGTATAVNTNTTGTATAVNTNTTGTATAANTNAGALTATSATVNGTATINGVFSAGLPTGLGTALNNSQLLEQLTTTTSNYFALKTYTRRYAAGASWNTAAIHESVDVDGVFNTPGSNTKTWYERRPGDPAHVWGDQTSLFAYLNGTGLGIRNSAPVGPLDARGAFGKWITWEGDAIGGTAVQVVPAGTFAYGIVGMAFVRCSDNSYRSFPISGAVNGNGYTVGSGARNIYTSGDGTTAVLVLNMNGDGSITVQRTAGSATFRVALWLCGL